MAQAALDLVLEKVPGRAATATYFDRQSDVPGVQADLANAAALVESAHLHAYLAAAEIDQNAHDGVYPNMLGRAKARMDTAVAVKYAREAIRLLLGVYGAASFATGGPMQRIWSNAEAASTHTVLRPEINSQLYGQHLLGIEGGVTPVL